MQQKTGICIIFLIAISLGSAAQTGGTFTDGRDGHTYRTVTIGSQTWMAENMAYLPQVDRTNDLSWDESRYWVYDYYGWDVNEAVSTENYKTHGVLYNWPAALNDACPDGWRVSEESDWRELEKSLGMSDGELPRRDWRETGAAGKQLKSVSGWYADSGSNESGFDALPGGLLGYDAFECIGYGAYFWVSTATHTDNAWIRSLLFDSDGVQRIEERKWFGCSVRCVKTKE
ncbi:MAG: hypothetical protein IH591_07200 [Bacteroidales bacterium]|nr:hypothetical protein [Bacteroidales bacterium]